MVELLKFNIRHLVPCLPFGVKHAITTHLIQLFPLLLNVRPHHWQVYITLHVCKTSHYTCSINNIPWRCNPLSIPFHVRMSHLHTYWPLPFWGAANAHRITTTEDPESRWLTTTKLNLDQTPTPTIAGSSIFELTSQSHSLTPHDGGSEHHGSEENWRPPPDTATEAGLPAWNMFSGKPHAKRPVDLDFVRATSYLDIVSLVEKKRHCGSWMRREARGQGELFPDYRDMYVRTHAYGAYKDL